MTTDKPTIITGNYSDVNICIGCGKDWQDEPARRWDESEDPGEPRKDDTFAYPIECECGTKFNLVWDENRGVWFQELLFYVDPGQTDCMEE